MPSALQMSEVATTGGATAAANPFVGCYTLSGDSTSWPSALPNRFSLAQIEAPSSPKQNVVRAVTPDGRLDSVVAGTSWTQLSANRAMVSFTAERARQQVTLQLASNGTVVAEPGSRGRSQPLRLSRTEPLKLSRTVCRP
jgi:hypothetical protein